jgi:NADH-quinone oxidoreductase subunit L
MPWTAFTMLVGVIAIAGLAIPGTPLAFSGFHSKDAIVATALRYMELNPIHFLLFLTPLVTAGITAFYMFRLWFYTFTGKPRDEHVYEHCHESPVVMVAPLVLLSVFAAFCAFGGEDGPLYCVISYSEPVGVGHDDETAVGLTTDIALPSHNEIHNVHGTAGAFALLAAALGTIAAALLYWFPMVDPGTIKRQFSGLHKFLVNKWQFDELYDVAFVRPAHSVGRWCVNCDKYVFDGFLHSLVRASVWVAFVDRKFDEGIIDGLVNLAGTATRAVGMSLSVFQTGRIRQYVMFIAVSVVALFALLFAFITKA